MPASSRFGLFVLFVGLKTDQNIRNELILVQRWGLLAIFVAIAAVGRFADGRLRRAGYRARKRAKAAAPTVERLRRAGLRPPEFQRRSRLLRCSSIRSVIVALFGFQGSLKWVDNFGIQILIYVMLAWGLNIVVGLAGLLDLGYVAFYAVGAYSYALLSARISACRSGCCCRSPAFWRRSGASSSAFRCCGCAATIWRS